MTASAFPDIHYQRLMKEGNIQKQNLKPYLKNCLGEMSSIMMEIDFAVAGNEIEKIKKALGELKALSLQIHADTTSNHIDILNDIVQEEQGHTSIIHYQGRLDHVLNNLRECIFTYSEIIEQDL